jgi:hypothetical protein
MNKNVYMSIAGILIILALVLLSPSRMLAQSGTSPSNLLGTGYELTWWTVDGGGISAGAGSPGPYTLGGTIGQPDAALWQGATYTLSGGFWSGVNVEFYIYLPVSCKNSILQK